MKKLLFLSVSMVLVVGVNAQFTKTIPFVPGEAISAPNPQKMEKEFANYAAEDISCSHHATFPNVSEVRKKRQKSGSYTPFGYISSTTYAASIAGNAGVIWGNGNPYSSVSPLFPDSLASSHFIITNAPANSFKRPFHPAIGYTFDPYSRSFDATLTDRLFEDPITKELCGYSIDTLLIYGEYRMANYNPNSPDTLRIFLSHYNNYNYPNGNPDPRKGNEYFTLTFSSYGTRIHVPIVEYDNRNNIAQKGPVTKPAAASTVAIDYILSDKDSANLPLGLIGYRVMTIPVADYIGNSFEVPVGSVTSVIMKFIPGYNYSNGDTIRKTSYNSGSGAYVADEIRQNVFSVATINNDQYFENFLDWGGGYNGRLMENQDVRYDMDIANKNATWNPDHHSVYNFLYYAIPCVYMHVSTDEDWWNPNPPPVPMYTIRGNISANGSPLTGVKIACSNGGSATTDANGGYSITVDSNETVTLTPSFLKHYFTPPSITCSSVAGNLTNQNFTAIPFPTYTIQGTVSYMDDPLDGVTITCSNGSSVITDINGEYTLTAIDSGETVTLTASMAGYNFNPPSITCSDIAANLTDQNFTATLPTYTVQGYTRFNGNPLAGVTIDCSNGNSEFTNANGEYYITVEHGDSVTIIPSLNGYTFSPSSYLLLDVASNYTDVNFTASGVGIATIINNNSITIYPNPVNNQLKIESGEKRVDKLDIIDITGKAVKTYLFNSPINTILDVSDLQNGIYFMAFYSEGQKIMRKMVKYSSEP